MIASSDSIEGATETNSRIRLINGGESPPANNPHVAAYIRTHPGSAPTVKQHLAAIRVLCPPGAAGESGRGGAGPKHVEQIAGHASPRTTKLYDRTADTVTLDEIERIVI